jgi:hypothetical protein
MAAFIAAAKALKKGTTTRDIPNDPIPEQIKCPFDLDEIFRSDTERFGQLQDVIKFIFE